jgi:hypothetical protein
MPKRLIYSRELTIDLDGVQASEGGHALYELMLLR